VEEIGLKEGETGLIAGASGGGLQLVGSLGMLVYWAPPARTITTTCAPPSWVLCRSDRLQ
jgi:hypothetical protein